MSNITPPPELVQQWMPVPGYEGLYSVSSLGNVRSEERVTTHGSFYRTVKERILCQNKTTNGYLALRLWRNGRFRDVRQALRRQLLAIASELEAYD